MIELMPDADISGRSRESFRNTADHPNIALQVFDLRKRCPKNPADRIIGATSLIEDIPLITADAEIRRSRAVPTIW